MAISVFDCHADTPVLLWRKNQSLRENDCCVSLNRASGLAHYAQFFAYCTYAGLQLPNGLCCADFYTKPREYMERQLRLCQDAVRFCTTAQQVEQSWEEQKAAALYSLEGPEAIACDPGRLEQLWREGVRMTTLTWNADNALAGCHMGAQLGLSELGREYVIRAQRLGMIVDVSHCSDRAFWGILDTATCPVIASHSNSRAVMPHSRNLTDEMFDALCQTGGLTGINLYADFLCEKEATFENVYAHIDHFLQRCGTDTHVALGGDLDGCETMPQGFSHVGDYASLSEYLLEKYPRETVENLFYRNILCVMREVNHE